MFSHLWKCEQCFKTDAHPNKHENPVELVFSIVLYYGSGCRNSYRDDVAACFLCYLILCTEGATHSNCRFVFLVGVES